VREHTKLLFLGADWSGKALDKLMKRVRYAFSIQGGLQQGPLLQETKEDEKEIMDTAKDLFVALTGYEVKAYTKADYY